MWVFLSIFLLRATSDRSKRSWEAGESSVKKVREEHLGIHSHREQLCRKEVTRSKEEDINS